MESPRPVYAVRCKFKLTGMKSYIGGAWDYTKNASAQLKLVDFEFRVVNPKHDDPSDENKKYWSSTPTGELKFGTVNQAAVDSLEIGKDYYVTIEEVPGTVRAPDDKVSTKLETY